MIDPADQQTQPLPLDEQPAKRKRGRPTTGKAMTPAEKQKAYRDRLKSRNVTVNNEESPELLKKRIGKMGNRQLRLEQELIAWKARAEAAEAKLSSRDHNSKAPK